MSKGIVVPPLEEIHRERARRSFPYFVDRYCQVLSGFGGLETQWIPFKLWKSQVKVAEQLQLGKLTCVLKARQLGLTWLCVGLGLWHVLFRPVATVLLFSRRDDEAVEFLSRVKGMAKRLPSWLWSGEATTDNDHEWEIAGGSRVLAFPTTAGDSYTGTLAVVDEADLLPDLDALLRAVKPTIDGGGKLVLVSRSNKSEPNSPFKKIYRAGVAKESGWESIFLPWDARPDRDAAWYAQQMKDALGRAGGSMAGALDYVNEQYPACVVAETRVSTEDGIVQIAQALRCRTTESGPILASSVQPASTIYRLDTDRGRVLRGTFDHPVMTEAGFVRLSELQPGTKIQLRPPCFAASNYTERWRTIPGSETTVEIGQEWARLIGLFMGDGSWHKDEIEIACDAKDQDVVAETVALVEKLIGGPAALKHVARIHGRKGCTYVRLGRKDARDAFRRLGLIRPRNQSHIGGGSAITRWVHVPDCIWKSPKPVVREFLRGLFESDGSASKSVVSFSSCKIDHVRDVQLLLLGFGINSRIICNKKRAGNGSKYILNILNLTKEQSLLFADRIGFIGERKQSLALAAEKKPRSDGREVANRHPNEMIDEVATVQEDGFEATYNFTIDETNVFSANGILTHNTDAEALAPLALDKRLPAEWLHRCYRPATPLDAESLGPKAPAIPGLQVFQPPSAGHWYCVGADPAEGSPTSDESAISVVDVHSGEEVAMLAGLFEPATFAAHISAVAHWYNGAHVLVERNNHGHAVILWLRDNTRLRIMTGHDGNPGWHTTTKSKAILYDTAGVALRDADTTVHSLETYTQLASIEGSTLRAPNGQHDDRAVAFVLAVVGRSFVLVHLKSQEGGLLAYPQDSDLNGLRDDEVVVNGIRVRFDEVDDNDPWR